MKNRSVALGFAAAVLLSVPVIVVAQEGWFRAAGRGPLDPPEFVGGSGRAVPRGSLEVAAAEIGGALTRADGAEIPLATAVGTLLSQVDGAVLAGYCEVVAPGGASFIVPQGSKALVRATPDGGFAFEALSGDLFAKNDEVTLNVAPGGAVGASDLGRFQGIRGEGRVGRETRWVTWRSEGRVETIGPAELKEIGYEDVDDSCDPVSPSKGKRGKKDD